MQRVFSAGGAVFKKRPGEILWLVRRAKPSELYPEEVWTLPKGLVDGGEKTEPAAVREVKEETGVEAKVIKKITDQRNFFTPRGESEKIFKIISYFLMEFVKEAESGFGEETTEVAWLSCEGARKKLKYSSEKRVLDLANDLV